MYLEVKICFRLNRKTDTATATVKLLLKLHLHFILQLIGALCCLGAPHAKFNGEERALEPHFHIVLFCLYVLFIYK
jgi:hypothetical protein